MKFQILAFKKKIFFSLLTEGVKEVRTVSYAHTAARKEITRDTKAVQRVRVAWLEEGSAAGLVLSGPV